VSIGASSYFGPFAEITGSGKIVIGSKSNLQDNVSIYGSGNVTIGDEVILAHGAQVKAPAKIGGHKPTFIGFNSLIDGATMEEDSAVLHLSRVAPGLIVKAGTIVVSGVNVTKQSQLTLGSADAKVVPMSEGMHLFMEGVLHVNETFATEYSKMSRESSSKVKGINYDPAHPSFTDATKNFNLVRNLPTLAGMKTSAPTYRNRIIGDVQMADAFAKVNSTSFYGSKIALRADEGEQFIIGSVKKMNDRVTFHALEHNNIHAGNNVTYGFRSTVHGGESPATVYAAPHSAYAAETHAPKAITRVGDNTIIGSYSVVFKSAVGSNVRIGCGSLIEGSTLPNGYIVPANSIVTTGADGKLIVKKAEWNPGCSD
jgi:carbonic anhydrase/acetyltransferase-like protein (isoleucine patch superfamily)